MTRSETPTLRPIRPQDIERLQRLFERLSPQTRYLRFFSPVQYLDDRLLRHFANVDHRDREAVAAVIGDEVVGVARYDRIPSQPHVAEFAVVVEDAWQRRGVGSALLSELARIARSRGIRRFTAVVLSDNAGMAALVRSLWPDARWRWDDGYRNVDVDLERALEAPVQTVCRAS